MRPMRVRTGRLTFKLCTVPYGHGAPDKPTGECDESRWGAFAERKGNVKVRLRIRHYNVGSGYG
jgi:hypothetical protein